MTPTSIIIVSKFREGDWARLREEIEEGAENVFDLAAEADIEDVLMCDYAASCLVASCA